MQNEKPLAPETQAIHGFYKPELSEGAIKPPLFASSTFVAQSAKELADWFAQAYGLHGEPTNPSGLIYSRLVNPNLEIFEQRVAVYEQAEEAALFASGMASITTTLLTFCRPGDTVLTSSPVYGGTDFLLHKVLPQFGIESKSFDAMDFVESIKALLESTEKVKVVFLESPANPTLRLADIPGIVKVVKEVPPETLVIVDNTVLGPVFQKVLAMGADLAIFSATKIISGHSDLIAGLVMGNKDLVTKIKGTRTIMGTMNDPHAAWLLTRSLETLKIRAQNIDQKAKKIAKFLLAHDRVEQVLFPGMQMDEEQQRRFDEQCTGSGGLMSFLLKDASADDCYQVLDKLQVINLAVSLGGTESLAEHPASHTHADISPEEQAKYGITQNMIRLSVGLEDADDIIADLAQALA